MICVEYDITKKTVRKFFKKFCTFLRIFIKNNITKIGGENTIVEIDESKFGRKKFNRDHKVDGVWVIGFMEKTVERKIILIEVEKRDARTIENLL